MTTTASRLAVLLRDAHDRLEVFLGGDCECDNTHLANDTACCLCGYRAELERFDGTQSPMDQGAVASAVAGEVTASIPDSDGRWGRGYRTAIESMTLALRSAGVAEDVIAVAVTTTLDAYGNHNDDHTTEAEVHDLLIVTTGHLSPAEREEGALEDVFDAGHADPEVLADWGGSAIVVSFTADHGFQLYVPIRDGKGDPAQLYERLYPHMSVGLTGVIRRAVELGCEYVRFDCDADPLPGVPYWEESPELFV